MKAHLDANQRYKAGDIASNWIKDISHNVVTPAYILRRLAKSADSELRIAVADHVNTSEEVLLLLADDSDVDVRFAVAENHNISRNVLDKLREDVNPYVAHRAQTTLNRLFVNSPVSISVDALAS